MKVLDLTVILCLVRLAKAIQPLATAYSFASPSIALQQPPTIAASSALLVLAQHLGLDDYYTAAGADETVLRLANSVGESQQTMFASDVLASSKAIIFIDGLDTMPNDLSKLEPAFHISDPQSQSSNKALLKHFNAQHEALSGLGKAAQPRDDSPCGIVAREMTARFESEIGIELKEAGVSWYSVLSCHNTDYAGIQFSGFDQLRKSSSGSNKLYSAATRILSDIIRDIVEEFPETILVVSPSVSTKTTPNAYGFHAHHNHLRPRQHRPEALLSDTSPETPVSVASSSEASDLPITNGTFKKGVILPFCYATEPLLVKSTKNCTGHGYPYLKYKSANEKNKNGTAAVQCWACNCVSTYTLSSDGMNKTTFWSGPACQKKDVSAPFFLIAGFTIFIVGIASWGIGLLFGIGQEDLPGVIGAGVAGPKAK